MQPLQLSRTLSSWSLFQLFNSREDTDTVGWLWGLDIVDGPYIFAWEMYNNLRPSLSSINTNNNNSNQFVCHKAPSKVISLKSNNLCDDKQ